MWVKQYKQQWGRIIYPQEHILSHKPQRGCCRSQRSRHTGIGRAVWRVWWRWSLQVTGAACIRWAPNPPATRENVLRCEVVRHSELHTETYSNYNSWELTILCVWGGGVYKFKADVSFTKKTYSLYNQNIGNRHKHMVIYLLLNNGHLFFPTEFCWENNIMFTLTTFILI